MSENSWNQCPDSSKYTANILYEENYEENIYLNMKISVFITSYNQKKFLIEAIESVLNQTLSPFQIIVVDDSSKDLSQEVIAGYAARYPNLITPIFHKRNTGVAQVRIDALNAVNGDYVT
ncbi:MAG: glycosyltransferase family 2 protein, partial [Deltaproteobacteria bacterium]|nr:glycosyltransferase family 2 protein [Deltaproteobacteria bacterium]